MFDKINNVSHTLIINTFEGFYYKDSSEISNTLKRISEFYQIKRLINISRKIAESIKVDILNESTHVFEPFGDSCSFLVGADLDNYNTGAVHLKESHITFHTYLEEKLENFLIIRFELHICSCANENIFLSLSEIFNKQTNSSDGKNFLTPHLIGIDYIKRGSVLTPNHRQERNNGHTLTKEIFDEAFGNQYVLTNKFDKYINQQNILMMKNDLIEEKLHVLESNISNKSFKKYLDCLTSVYKESFLK
ncbi:MAG: hypothetical protein VYE60_00435 [Pseudomonadota bacterium]|nr:hypothetical protein [Pseudomonadota bacterium]